MKSTKFTAFVVAASLLPVPALAKTKRPNPGNAPTASITEQLGCGDLAKRVSATGAVNNSVSNSGTGGWAQSTQLPASANSEILSRVRAYKNLDDLLNLKTVRNSAFISEIDKDIRQNLSQGNVIIDSKLNAFIMDAVAKANYLSAEARLNQLDNLEYSLTEKQIQAEIESARLQFALGGASDHEISPRLEEARQTANAASAKLLLEDLKDKTSFAKEEKEIKSIADLIRSQNKAGGGDITEDEIIAAATSANIASAEMRLKRLNTTIDDEWEIEGTADEIISQEKAGGVIPTAKFVAEARRDEACAQIASAEFSLNDLMANKGFDFKDLPYRVRAILDQFKAGGDIGKPLQETFVAKVDKVIVAVVKRPATRVIMTGGTGGTVIAEPK